MQAKAITTKADKSLIIHLCNSQNFALTTAHSTFSSKVCNNQQSLEGFVWKEMVRVLVVHYSPTFYVTFPSLLPMGRIQSWW
jgi:hypothetical protein